MSNLSIEGKRPLERKLGAFKRGYFPSKQKTAPEGAILNSVCYWASVLVTMIILTVFVVFYIVYTIKELKIIREKVDSIIKSNTHISDDSSDNHEKDKNDTD